MWERIKTKPGYKVLLVAALIIFAMNLDYKWQRQEHAAELSIKEVNCQFCHVQVIRTKAQYKKYHQIKSPDLGELTK